MAKDKWKCPYCESNIIEELKVIRSLLEKVIEENHVIVSSSVSFKEFEEFVEKKLAQGEKNA